jgi:hypothetical protein
MQIVPKSPILSERYRGFARNNNKILKMNINIIYTTKGIILVTTENCRVILIN